MKHEVRKINDTIVISGPHGGTWSIERGNEEIVFGPESGASETLVLDGDKFGRVWDGVERSGLDVSGDGTETVIVDGDVKSVDVFEQWHKLDGPAHPPKKLS